MLTDAQIVTFAAAIAAETDPEFVALRTAGATGQMAEWYNVNSTFVVWRTSLSEQEITSEVSPEATVWDWTAFIARSVGEKEAWARMFNGTYIIDPSLPQVRSGVGDIFSGPLGADQRTHLLAMAKRPATRGEEVFTTGTGSVADPGLLTFEGFITDMDVVRAVNL